MGNIKKKFSGKGSSLEDRIAPGGLGAADAEAEAEEMEMEGCDHEAGYLPHGDGVCEFPLMLEDTDSEGNTTYSGFPPDLFEFSDESTIDVDGDGNPDGNMLTIPANYAQFIDVDLTGHFPPYEVNEDGSISIQVPEHVTLDGDGSLVVGNDPDNAFNGHDFLFTIHDSHSEGIGTEHVEGGVEVTQPDHEHHEHHDHEHAHFDDGGHDGFMPPPEGEMPPEGPPPEEGHMPPPDGSVPEGPPPEGHEPPPEGHEPPPEGHEHPPEEGKEGEKPPEGGFQEPIV